MDAKSTLVQRQQRKSVQKKWFGVNGTHRSLQGGGSPGFKKTRLSRDKDPELSVKWACLSNDKFWE